MDFTSWSVLWIGWILTAVVMDVRAAKNGQRGDTLTEHFQWWIGLGKHKYSGNGLWYRRVGALAFFAWAIIHLFTGWV